MDAVIALSVCYQAFDNLDVFLLLAAGIGLFIYQMKGFFRGGDHHEDSHLEEGNASPDPREHSHGQGPAHSHLEKAEPAAAHEHSREDGHSHGHTHQAYFGRVRAGKSFIVAGILRIRLASRPESLEKKSRHNISA